MKNELVLGNHNTLFYKLTRERTWQELPKTLTITPQNKMIAAYIAGNEHSRMCSPTNRSKTDKQEKGKQNERI